MNSSEQKKQRNRRKYKKESASCQNDGQVVGLSLGLATADAILDNLEIDAEKIINTSRLSSLETISKIEQMMDSGEDPLPTLDISQGTNPYFSRQKCLICQRDQVFVSSIQTLSGDGCDEIGVLAGCEITIDQFHVWVCADCRRAEIDRKQGTCGAQNLASDIRLSPVVFDAACADLSRAACRTSSTDITASGMACPCKACHERRELESEQEKEDLLLHNCWASMQKVVRRIYHEGAGSEDGGGGGDNSNICGEKLKDIVHRLCLCNPHQLFLWLESQCREMVVGMKGKLLKQLDLGTKSPQKAKAFVNALLDHYAKLCAACKRLHSILKELQEHLHKLNLNWELVNRHLFQSLVYSDHRVQNALPTIVALLRLPLDDEREQTAMTNLLLRYVKFDQQMTMVSVMWRDAEPLVQEMNNEQAALKVKQRKLKEDWDLFRMQRKMMELKKSNSAPMSCSCEECALKNLFSCGYLTHQSASLGLDAELGLMLQEAVDGCTPIARGVVSLDHFISSNFTFSLDPRSVHSEDPTLTAATLHNDCEDRKHSHQHRLPTDCGKPGSPPSSFDSRDHEDGDSPVASDGGDDSREDNNDESDCSSGTDDDDEEEEEEEEEEGEPQLSDSCGNGVLGCQCDQSMSGQMPCPALRSAASSLPQSPPLISGTNAPSVSSPDKQLTSPSDPHPCECHVCVHHADRATIPAVVSAPPRPAALHLYPHIHGSNTAGGGLSLHAVPPPPHLFKPLLHSHLYGAAAHTVVPPLPSKQAASEASVVVVPPLTPSDGHHHHHHHNCTDCDQFLENTKLLLNSGKYGGGLLLPHDVLDGAEVVSGSQPPPFETFDAVDVDMSFLANYHWPDLETKCPVAVAASQHPKVSTATPPPPSPAHVATSSKATQASGSAGGGRHLLDHVARGKQSKQHEHVDGIGGSPVASSVGWQEPEGGGGQDGQLQQRMPDGEDMFAAGVAKTMEVLKEHFNKKHGCSVPAGTPFPSHLAQQLLNKHSCMSESCACLPDASMSSGSHGSSCPNQDTDSFSGDPEESLDDTCSERSSSTSTSNQKENKHCDCCYCEVFGHDVASQPPLSRNYTEMRDKLRMRLSKKKSQTVSSVPMQMDCKNSVSIGPSVPQKEPLEDRRDIDSLINFINGDKKNRNDAANAAAAAAASASSLTKPSKKSSKKPKKMDNKLTSSSKGNCEKGYSSDTTCCHGPVATAYKDPGRPERRGSPKITTSTATAATTTSVDSVATALKKPATTDSFATKKSNACLNVQPTPVVRKVVPPAAAVAPPTPQPVPAPVPKAKSRSETPAKQSAAPAIETKAKATKSVTAKSVVTDAGNGKAQATTSTPEAPTPPPKVTPEVRTTRPNTSLEPTAPIPSPRVQQQQQAAPAAPCPASPSPSPAFSEKKTAAASKKKRKASQQPSATSSPSPVTTESHVCPSGERQRQVAPPPPPVTVPSRLAVAAPTNQRSSPSPRNGTETQRSAGRGQSTQQQSHPVLHPAVTGATYVSSAHRTATSLTGTAMVNGTSFMEVNGSIRRHQMSNNFKVAAGVGDKDGLLPHTNGVTSSDFRATPASSSPTKVKSRVVGNSLFAGRFHTEMTSEVKRNGSGGHHHGSGSGSNSNSVTAGTQRELNSPQSSRSLTNGRNGKHNQKLSPTANNVEHAPVDDIFVPIDDLDTAELDESDREVEAFKRFCWNSVPVANKEKVHVNLKDLRFRKKSMLGCS